MQTALFYTKWIHSDQSQVSIQFQEAGTNHFKWEAGLQSKRRISIQSHIHTCGQFRVASGPNLHARLWVETWAPRGREEHAHWEFPTENPLSVARFKPRTCLVVRWLCAPNEIKHWATSVCVFQWFNHEQSTTFCPRQTLKTSTWSSFDHAETLPVNCSLNSGQ